MLSAELGSINHNTTWVRPSLLEGRNAVPCQLVWKRKLNNGGSVVRYKARIASKGYYQKYGIDYDETFAPLLSYYVFVMNLGTYVSKGWVINPADISTAFINRVIDGELYVEWKG